MTEVELELISDTGKYYFIEEAISGEVSSVSKRYS